MRIRQFQPGGRSGRRGFTLIELLAVIVILGILMTVLITQLGSKKTLVEEKMTLSSFKMIEAAIGVYELDQGDYPTSRYDGKDWGTAPNNTNLGAEALVLRLFSKDIAGTELSEDDMVNLDGDRSKKHLTTFGKQDLFELGDAWGNPIAYFHRRDYGRQDVYLSYGEEDEAAIESTVTAKKNQVTGSWANSKKYQLISAGVDGEFGTPDDLYNFKYDPQ